MVVVVDDFDSGFVDFGCGGGMIFDFFFSFYGGGDGGCCGYGFVVRCLVFFFFLWVWLCLVVVVVVVGVVVGVADGRGGCGWCWVVFLGSGIYYIIVDDILFYYEIYIILLY